MAHATKSEVDTLRKIVLAMQKDVELHSRAFAGMQDILGESIHEAKIRDLERWDAHREKDMKLLAERCKREIDQLKEVIIKRGEEHANLMLKYENLRAKWEWAETILDSESIADIVKKTS